MKRYWQLVRKYFTLFILVMVFPLWNSLYSYCIFNCDKHYYVVMKIDDYLLFLFPNSLYLIFDSLFGNPLLCYFLIGLVWLALARIWYFLRFKGTRIWVVLFWYFIFSGITYLLSLKIFFEFFFIKVR